MSTQIPESSDPTAGLRVNNNVRNRATEVMDQALELAAEERLSISSESDDDDDVSTAKPNTTQRRQIQNAKFDALYVHSNPMSSSADLLKIDSRTTQNYLQTRKSTTLSRR